jgi:hypothetical protein
MKSLLLFIGTILILATTACEKQDEKELTSAPSNVLQELITSGEVTGDLNPFQLHENPTYKAVHEVDFLQDDELVFVSKACGLILVYPVRSMYVELVNEAANGVYMAVSYCPITRSGISINRLQGNDTLLLTASGYLYRENLVPLDLHTGSLWSQMQLRVLAGSHQGEVFETFPLIETSWKTVKDYFPSAGVYRVESFPKAAFLYEQPYGILGRTEVELFTLDMFPGEISLRSTVVQPGGKTIVAGSSNHRFIVAFQTSYKMEAVEGHFPVIMKDESGTLWTIFGEAVSGPRGGEKLQSPVAYTAADWAWNAHFEDVSYHATSP